MELQELDSYGRRFYLRVEGVPIADQELEKLLKKFNP